MPYDCASRISLKLRHVEPKAQRIILLGIHNDGFGAGSWELAELI